MAEHQFSKLMAGVRFPYPAQKLLFVRMEESKAGAMPKGGRGGVATFCVAK